MAIHARDFTAVKRQIRNADYAGAAPPSAETPAYSTAHSSPPKTSTADNASASRSTNPTKGTSKDSRSVGSRYNSDSSGLPPSNLDRSSDDLVLDTGDKRNTDASPRQKSRKLARGDASPVLPSRAYTGTTKKPIDENHTRRSLEMPGAEWWKKRELVKKAVLKSPPSRDDSEIITRALQELPAKGFAENASTDSPSKLDSKHLRRVSDSDTREVKTHEIHNSEFSRETTLAKATW